MPPRALRLRFLNLFRLRYPVGAVCSFGHRVSGILLALSLPGVIYLLRQSLEGPSGYAAAARLMSSIPAKTAAVLFIWALAHHVLAGVRHLLKDADLGSSLAAGRRSAWSVNLLAALLAILALGALW